MPTSSEVRYQPGAADQFIHRYVYDADNRITKVRTSRDGWLWEEDARYFYYPHGPLSRVEIGEDNLQGLDYYYTLHGWLKGINGPGNQLDEDIDFIASTDPGLDGYTGTGNLHRWTGRDELALGLGYFAGDYSPIGATAAPALTGAFTGMAADILQGGLYNGNIAWMATMLPEMGRISPTPLPVLEAYAFQYDQLHRLRQNRRYGWDGTAWDALGNKYREDYEYDPNGNIRELDRWDGAGTHIDNLSYIYTVDGNDKLTTDNRLLWVDDPNGTHTVSGMPVGDLGGQIDGNYAYDGIGNLTQDTKEGITSIVWNPQGKVKEVRKAYDPVEGNEDLEFRYDGMGNRIMKIVKPHTGESGGMPVIADADAWIYTIYVRDASGNVMAIYDKLDGAVTLEEQPIYGSSRVGMYKYTINSENKRILGSKRYELTNHLGNVNAVITDVRIGTDDFEWDGTGWVAGGDGIVDYYRPTVVAAYDYYPFGWTMPGRKKDGGYRFGFNGKENDNEVKGVGNSYDFGARIYDPRIGRWSRVDNFSQRYPHTSPYVYTLNNPLIFNDPDGNVVVIAFTGGFDGGGKVNTDNGTAASIVKSAEETAKLYNTEFSGITISSGATEGYSVSVALEYIKSNYSTGESIVIYGYSWGGDFAVVLAEKLAEEGFSVELLVTVDASDGYVGLGLNLSVDNSIPENVVENINFYQETQGGFGADGEENRAENPAKTIVRNIEVRGKGVTHGNIDEFVKTDVIEHIGNVIRKEATQNIKEGIKNIVKKTSKLC